MAEDGPGTPTPRQRRGRLHQTARLTTLLVVLSHLSQGAAVWGLMLITPLKAALVFYFFMHLRYEGPLLKGVVTIALVTLLIFFALLFSDVAFR